MTTLRSRLVLLLAVVSLLTVMAAPALAGRDGPVSTEVVEEGDHGEENDKIQLPASSHHKVGLIVIGASIVFGLVALDNARRRLKGEGEKATGEFRWR